MFVYNNTIAGMLIFVADFAPLNVGISLYKLYK